MSESWHEEKLGAPVFKADKTKLTKADFLLISDQTLTQNKTF